MIIGLSILSVVLFIGLICLWLYVGNLKLENFKSDFLKDKKIESLQTMNEDLKTQLNKKESEVNKYSASLGDSVEKLDEVFDLLKERDKVIDVFDEVLVNIQEFHDHLKGVSELKIYYGDQTIMGLVDHSKYIMKYIEDLNNGVIIDEEKKVPQRSGFQVKIGRESGQVREETPETGTNEEGEETEGEGEEVLDQGT